MTRLEQIVSYEDPDGKRLRLEWFTGTVELFYPEYYVEPRPAERQRPWWKFWTPRGEFWTYWICSVIDRDGTPGISLGPFDTAEEAEGWIASCGLLRRGSQR